MNFIGEEPTWEKMELLERVSAPQVGVNDSEFVQAAGIKKDIARLKNDRTQLASKLQRI